MNPLQRELTSIKRRSHLAGRKQAAVELVSPLMVGADELGSDAVRLLANPGAPMAAAVQGRANPSGAGGRHQKELGPARRGKSRPCPSQLIRRGSKQPPL